MGRGVGAQRRHVAAPFKESDTLSLRPQRRLTFRRHNSYAGLARLFRNRVDPWHFASSPYERRRFAAMLHFVRAVPHARILEVGCAEGHFTEQLVRLSGDVTAIDLSPDAIARARERAPQARFLTCTIEELPPPTEPYDVIVCGEMLYYLEDIDATIAQLRQMGVYLVTSTCYPSAPRIHAKLATCDLVQTRRIARVRQLKAAALGLWKL